MDPLEPILDWLVARVPKEQLKAFFESIGLGKGCSSFLVGCIVVMVVVCFILSCWAFLWIFGLWDVFVR